MQRIEARGQGSDAFEKRSFHEAVAGIYAEMRLPFLHRIDATGTPEQTQSDILQAVRYRLGV